MNANELTFGIEIETHLSSRSRVRAGHYHAGNAVTWMPEGWTAQSDSSIHAPRGRKGVEFVSPVLKGAEGVASVIKAVKALNDHGAAVNQSTGLHVHVGWSGDQEALARLVTLVANFEKAIYASTGTKSREQGHYCAGLRRHGSTDAARNASYTQRYHVLNLTNLATGRKHTVEFRAFPGTLNIVKILGYIRLCLGLVERAMKASRKTDFTPKKPCPTSPITRGGEGQTELNRLFYQLGWTKGRQSYEFGNVTAEGAPTRKEVKRELMRLAKKYDGPQAPDDQTPEVND